MKKFLLLFFGIVLITSTSFYFSKNESKGHGGRCTGSAYCSACSNCSRCGHCGAGGTCGVCSGSSSGRSFSSSGKSKGTKKSQTTQSISYKKKSGQKLKGTPLKTNVIVLSRSINVFEKPSFQSKILESLPKKTTLILVSKLDSWYKVKIKKNEKIGYVYVKDVK